MLAAAWHTLRELTGMYLEDHAGAEGRTVDPVLAEWNTDQVLTSLRVTGPVAFKQAIADGHDETQARNIMAKRMAGAAERVVLRGERDTVMATVESSDEIVGWRRVPDDDPCFWCAMLVSRGAVYSSRASATQVVGRRGVARGNQALGASYHDHCQCTAVPLYEHEDEPPEVADLYQQWLDVTAGKSGEQALRAWRQYWDERKPTPRTEPEPAESTPPARETQPEREPPPSGPEVSRADREPQQPTEPKEEKPVPEDARPWHRSINGIEDLARAVEEEQPVERRALTGGVSADTELETYADGSRVVRKSGGNPDAEQAASMIARALGLRAPRIYRNSASSVHMEFIGDARTADQIGALNRAGDMSWGDLVQQRAAALESTEGHLIGLLDIMVTNGDRNAGNWMLTRDGQVIPIDHGHAFRGVRIMPSGRPVVDVGMASGPFVERLRDGRKFAPTRFTPADVDEMVARLRELEPDFEHIGKAGWLRYALAVLEVLRPQANGTVNLVAGVTR